MASKAITVIPGPARNGAVPGFAHGERALGGALEGVDRTKREIALWKPQMLAPDQAINTVKGETDARVTEMSLNDGYIQGAMRLQKNSVVGASYRLNAKPDYRVIYGNDSAAAQEYGEELAAIAEARFNLASESPDGWFDAGGMMTFTDQVRLVVGSCVLAAEAFGAVEWEDSDPSRPFKTAIQMISPHRICNQDGRADDRFLRRGIEIDRKGRPLRYHVRRGYQSEWYDADSDRWTIVEARKPWGRRQMLHIREVQQIDQTRGVAELVAALSHTRMAKKWSEITLQRAVVDATYATAIESELPPSEVIAAMGGGPEGFQAALGSYMGMLQAYLGAAENIAIDGVKMPHFFPGTKLNMKTPQSPGGVGSDFEASLHRRIAATLGVSYSDYTRDLSRTNYSGLKGELALADRDISVKKKTWADRWATMVYQLWFEEEMAAGNLPLPPYRNRSDFYRPLMKDAYTRCAWIGTGRGQIDEMKETQAAVLRIASGLSTYEDEAAKLGKDYRETFAQRAKENKLAKRLGLTLSTEATKPGTNQNQRQMRNNPDQGATEDDDGGDDE